MFHYFPYLAILYWTLTTKHEYTNINMNWSSGALVKPYELPLAWTISELIVLRAAVGIASLPVFPLKI